MKGNSRRFRFSSYGSALTARFFLAVARGGRKDCGRNGADVSTTSPVFHYSHAGHILLGLTYVSRAMGGSVAAPVASGRDRAKLGGGGVFDADNCFGSGPMVLARGAGDPITRLDERSLLPFGRSGPKGSRPEGTKLFCQCIWRAQRRGEKMAGQPHRIPISTLR
jgi:hypothetical protein